MFARRCSVPDHSFLFGPRGTGKTTWLRQALPDALCVRPLPQFLKALAKGDWFP